MPEFHGGCLCGKISYTLSADTVVATVCHCRNCQKASGSPFSTNLIVPDAAVTIEGTLKVFHDKGDSGRAVDRYFCDGCGSPIYTAAEGYPGVAIVKAGTLDDPSWVKPAVESFRDSKQPWVHLEGDMKRYPRMRT